LAKADDIAGGGFQRDIAQGFLAVDRHGVHEDADVGDAVVLEDVGGEPAKLGGFEGLGDVGGGQAVALGVGGADAEGEGGSGDDEAGLGIGDVGDFIDLLLDVPGGFSRNAMSGE